MDDGVEQSRVFRIAGIHESGQALPEIEVTVKEFEKTNWVLERWGADCVIEPGNSNKENVCCAILKTSKDSEKKERLPHHRLEAYRRQMGISFAE